MQVQPYLFFDGRCEEAIEFYRRTVGAKVNMLMRWKDAPEKNDACTPANQNQVMHAQVQIGDGEVMMSDGRGTGQPKFEGFSLTVSVPSEAEADRVFGALADGGQIRMPLDKTFFSPRFGMLADKFGVGWMVLVAPQ